ncbi:MAG: type II secretion system F family protein [Paracoccaceae bacterium]
MEILAPINELLVAQFGEFGPLMAVGFVGLVMIIITLPVMLNKKADPLDRLKAQKVSAKSAKTDERLRVDSRNQKLDRYASFLEPKSEEEYSAVRLKLIRAGYRSKDAVRYFHFAQFALGLGFLIAGVVYYITTKSGGETNTQQMAMYILGPGGVGYMLPKYWITKRVQTRQEEITNGFPDSLDMMLVCVEAGQSLDQSINRVSGELRASYPALADEFQMVAHEMKAGKDKVSVLGDMSERCGVQDVSSFVTVLVQSATFGTSISDALRVYAGEMRDKRVMRAEEAANKLPTKMTLATMMFTVPPLLIILVGPSVQGITQMGNMGGLQ